MKSNLKVPETIDYIVSWLREYDQNAGVKGFVVGISGGIDSALTSTLCAETGLPTLCVEIPIHQAESQVSRGKEQIDFLHSRYENVSRVEPNLTQTYETMIHTFPAIVD